MYETGWTKLCWPDAPITGGTVVGVLGRHFGLLSRNACRIVYTIEKDGPPLERYGFTFGTLPGHVEQGEERFTVEWHREDDSVWYEVFAFARPVHPLAKVGLPFVRLIQRRFAAASLRAMAAGPSQHLPVPKRVPHPFREPLQFIVISVIGVISLYLRGFCMTVN
jgi:hypothetical protein